MRLLIVDDNPQMRRLICSLLKDLSEEIAECSDGTQALAAYAQWRPDWVLMDIKMRQLDGIAATRQIRAAYPQARIMIVSDYGDHQLRDAARRAGACAYVVKEDLLAVRRILSPGGAEGA